jgi:hypothetical protein
MAAFQLHIGMVHFFEIFLRARKSNFSIDSSLGE